MADSKRKTELLNDNPLCGINTYKDTLNLATGTCTRQIKKLVFDGTEEWQNYGQVPNTYRISISNSQSIGSPAMCSHFVNSPISEITSGKFTVGSTWIYVRYADVSDLADFKSYLQQQYTNGTPVTIWYILATPETETITVPSGLSGTEEGYLNQSGTPTPTNPIYPTANNVEIWQHSLRKLGTSTDTITTLPADLYADGTNATVDLVGNMSQTGTPTPSSPIQPQECGDLETTGEHAGQYEIPISSANTTTPVYLGDVQSTRQIKKLVFDGTENWRQSANGAMYLSPFTGGSYKKEVAITSMNSHFAVQINTTSGTNQVRDNSACFLAASGSSEYYIGARSYSTAADFKTYLQQQYSAGTPVTVWYVLATPETAVVNEPLRKIGEYADTVSGITIPTITGKNTFDVLTTLKPSEVELTYTGWHDATVKEWDGSEWQ